MSTTVRRSAANIRAGQTIFNGSVGYLVRQLTGEGSYGIVAKCQNMCTGEEVAIKILKRGPHMKEDTRRELHMLDAISFLDPDQANVVKFHESFEYMGNTCMVFELLDKSLHTMMKERSREPLSLAEIRPIAKQLLVALDALNQLGVLHTDIKLDNIMLVNEVEQPLRVKLIDFGLAVKTSEVRLGQKMQPIGLRAPEVYLGLPITEAVDIFGLGCLLAHLYMGKALFPWNCEFQAMKCMVKVLGMPELKLICNGLYSGKHFIAWEDILGIQDTKCRLLTAAQYTEVTGKATMTRHHLFYHCCYLDDLFHPIMNESESDRLCFVDFLKHLLRFDANERTTAAQALDHPFITEEHLTVSQADRDNLNVSSKVTTDCQQSGNADLGWSDDEEKDVSSGRLDFIDDDSDFLDDDLTSGSMDYSCSLGQILSNIAEEKAVLSSYSPPLLPDAEEPVAFIPEEHLTVSQADRDNLNVSSKVTTDCQQSGNADLGWLDDEEKDMPAERLVFIDDDSDFLDDDLKPCSWKDGYIPGKTLLNIAEEKAVLSSYSPPLLPDAEEPVAFIPEEHLTVSQADRDNLNVSSKVTTDCQQSGNADLGWLDDEEKDMPAERLVFIDDDSDFLDDDLKPWSWKDGYIPGKTLSNIAEEKAVLSSYSPSLLPDAEEPVAFIPEEHLTVSQAEEKAEKKKKKRRRKEPFASSFQEIRKPVLIAQRVNITVAKRGLSNPSEANSASRTKKKGLKGIRKFCRRVASAFFCCLKCPKTVD